ncbi:hypothetical protein [Halorhodospira neutriphila]|mgnify:CR=1 FL=1|uniref:hypothetical protein n=1 Tax=Halorhodospira neutriphila TaxID=168379 RepID=UPI0019083361|nr:hypothetical protein [Halorhodospira neutriphila]
MTRESLQNQPSRREQLEQLSLSELRELLAAIDRELEARSFADSLEAQLRLFMRRREQ